MQSAVKHLAYIVQQLIYCHTRDTSSLLHAKNALHNVLLLVYFCTPPERLYNWLVHLSVTGIRMHSPSKTGNYPQVDDALRQVARHRIGYSVHVLQIAVPAHVVGSKHVQDFQAHP